MPLSEHEQRLFEQIEKSLSEDPKFASAVRGADPRVRARRRFVLAAGLIVAGLGLVVYGTVMKLPALGVAGFLVMLFAAVFGLSAVRVGHGTQVKAVGSSKPPRGRRHSVIDRLEERWRQRPEGQR